MLNKSLLACLGLLLYTASLFGTVKVNLDSSNLPIMIVVTKSSKVDLDTGYAYHDAYVWLIDNGPGKMNYVRDSAKFRYFGAFKLHGASSLSFDKKSYAMQLEDSNWNITDKSLLGMPIEHDWDLIGNYMDRSLIRNILGQHVFQAMGNYSPRFANIEMIVNKDYRGVYTFLEKAKRGPKRINIAKLSPTDNSGNALTGGYVIKTDWNSSIGFTSIYGYPDGGQNELFGYDDPDEATITTKQKAYISKFYGEFEDALYSNKTKGKKASDPPGYWRKYADQKSIIDYMFTEEMSKNLDDYRASFFMWKGRDSSANNGGKIHTGPVWDFDITWFDAGYQGGGLHYGWEFLMTPANFWWEKLMGPFPVGKNSAKVAWSTITGINASDATNYPGVENLGPGDDSFKNEAKCLWTIYRRGFASDSSMAHFIDSNAVLINDGLPLKKYGVKLNHKDSATPLFRNFRRWPIWGTSFWDVQPVLAKNYLQEIDTMKGFIYRRFAWMDRFMPGTCMRDIDPPVDTLAGADTVYLEVNTHYKDAGFRVLYDAFGDSVVTVSIGTNLDTSTLGTYIYSYFLSDSTGNKTTNQRVIIVIDTIRPTITFMNGDTVLAEVLKPYKDSGVVVADNYDLAPTLTTYGNFNFANNTPDMLGYYSIWYKATDQSGNVDSVMRVIKVVDTYAPQVNLNGRDTIIREVYSTYSDSGVTVKDNFDTLAVLSVHGNLKNYKTDSLGTFTIWYKGTDHSGNSDSVKRTVMVIDSIAPVITKLGADSVNVFQDSTYMDAGYTASDNYDKKLKIDTSGTYVNSQMSGTFNITYQAIDQSGNKSGTVNRVITVLKDTSSGINQAVNANSSISIYPNPGQGTFMISVKMNKKDMANLDVLDFTGRQIENMHFEVYNGWNYTLHLENYPAGIYTLKLQTGNSISTSKLILIK